MLRGFIHWVVLLVATADVLPQDDECLSGDCALHALQSKATMGSACHTAKAGDACYKDIQWAKHTGIKMHPHWYPGLSSHSSDDEFQQIVHSHNPQKCAAPCPKTKNTRCHTALPGDSCYKDVMWAKNHGIREHPNWYHGLSPSSTVEDFQAEIHAKRPDKCPMPCAKAEPEAVEPPIPGGFPVEEPESHESHESQPAPETTTVTTTRTRQTTEAPHHNHHHHHEDHDNSYQNSPCNQLHEQREREECFQREIRKEQLEREQREREESEAEQHRQENMPLDERQQEIIDEIGGVPTEDSLPDFDQFDPDR